MKRGKGSVLARALVSIVVSVAAAIAQSTALPAYETRLRAGERLLQQGRYGAAVTEFEAALLLAPQSATAYYNLGNALRLWGDFKGAENALKRAVSIQPGFPPAHFALGLIYGDRVGQEHEGLAAFRKAVELDPAYAEAYFNIGIVHWKAGDIESARAAFEKAAQLKPQSADYRFRLGQALDRLGRSALALQHLQAAVSSDPRHFQARYLLAQLLRRQGDDAKSAEQFAAAERLKRGSESTVATDQTNFTYKQGVTLLEQGDLDNAIARLTEALTSTTNQVQVRNALGIAFQKKGDTASAKRQYQQALALDGNSVDTHLNYGALLMSAGDTASAEREFKRCLEIEPAFAEARFNLGLLFASRGKWEEAAAEFRSVLTIQPRHAQAHWNLARVLRDRGKRQEALKEYASVCARYRTLGEAHLEYGKLLAAEGDAEKAIQVWQAALERTPAYRPLQSALLAELEQTGRRDDLNRFRAIIAAFNGEDYLAALRDSHSGRCSKAVATLTRILPNELAMRRQIAVTLFNCGQYEASVAEWNALVDADSTDADARLNRAIALYQAEQLPLAQKELEALLKQDPDLPQACFYMGLIRWKAGDRTTAFEWFHRARRSDPNVSLPSLTFDDLNRAPGANIR